MDEIKPDQVTEVIDRSFRLRAIACRTMDFGGQGKFMVVFRGADVIVVMGKN